MRRMLGDAFVASQSARAKSTTRQCASVIATPSVAATRSARGRDHAAGSAR